MDAQLAADASDVGAHCRVADPKPRGDVPAGHALGHQNQNLGLASCQRLEVAVDEVDLSHCQVAPTSVPTTAITARLRLGTRIAVDIVVRWRELTLSRGMPAPP